MIICLYLALSIVLNICFVYCVIRAFSTVCKIGLVLVVAKTDF